jgi:hypothetical protein
LYAAQDQEGPLCQERLFLFAFKYTVKLYHYPPIRDQRTAEQLSELVRNEAARGQLDLHQKVRAVDIFYRYLWSERQASKTPFNDGPESGAEYVLTHIRQALEQRRSAAKPNEIEEDPLDF